MRLPPELLDRIREFSQRVQKSESATVRMLLGASLGDEAATLAVVETAKMVDGARRHLLAELASELGPAFERVLDRYDPRGESQDR